MTVKTINKTSRKVITDTCVERIEQDCRYIKIYYDRRYKPTSISKLLPVDEYAMYSITE